MTGVLPKEPIGPTVAAPVWSASVGNGPTVAAETENGPVISAEYNNQGEE